MKFSRGKFKGLYQKVVETKKIISRRNKISWLSYGLIWDTYFHISTRDGNFILKYYYLVKTFSWASCCLLHSATLVPSFPTLWLITFISFLFVLLVFLFYTQKNVNIHSYFPAFFSQNIIFYIHCFTSHFPFSNISWRSVLQQPPSLSLFIPCCIL